MKFAGIFHKFVQITVSALNVIFQNLYCRFKPQFVSIEYDITYCLFNIIYLKTVFTLSNGYYS